MPFLSLTKLLDHGVEDKSWLNTPATLAERLSRGRWKRYRHLDFLCNEIATVQDGPQFLIINMPPRHGKSELISHWTPVWFLAKFPFRRVGLTSYQSGFASEWGGEVRDSINQNSDELGIILSKDSKAKDRWRISGWGGGMTATGIGGPLTGKGFELIIIDDPVKSQAEALSPVYREKIKRWYQSTLRTRLQPGGSIIILMTRWHQDDLCGWLLNEAKAELPYKDDWKVINLPALAEPTEKEPDPLGRAEGEALWPEMYPIDSLLTLKWAVGGSYWWTAEYQGKPRPEEGNKFKEVWFRYYDPFEPESMKKLNLKSTIQFWDTAFGKTRVSDRTACITMSEGEQGYYVRDLWFGRPEFPELTEVLKNQYRKWKPGRVMVEDKASGQSLIQQLRRDTKIPIIAVEAVDDKVTRASSVTGVVEAGRVYLPSGAPWLSEFLNEVCAFPAATYDDITDAFVYALMHFRPKRLPELGQRAGTSEESKSRWKTMG